jgi:hypothetical protein
MIRILYWNIQKFSANKVNGKTWADTIPANDRLNHIKQIIAPGSPPQRPPNMIIIVEVTVDQPLEVREFGAVLTPGSSPAEGVLTLLNHIRLHLGSTWCLVPPVPTGLGGKCEAVAVFYDSASLIFTGPYVYATDKTTWVKVDKAVPPDATNLGNLAEYTPPWGDYLPKHLDRHWTAPDGTTEVNERQGAGQWEYGNLRFPGSADRGPFYTRMKEVNGGRTIKVFSIHTSPDLASDAVRKLHNIPEVATVRNGEVAVIVGDFNVDTFRGDPRFPNVTLDDRGNPYEALVTRTAGGLGYRMLLDPCRPGTFQQLANRKSYCFTHLLPNKIRPGQPNEQNIATPYNAVGLAAPDPQHNDYPRFGYMGSYSTQSGNFDDIGALDNALVKWGPGLNPPDTRTTIVNPVVGQPYDRLNPPHDGVTRNLMVGYPQPSSLQTGIPLPGGINPNTATSFNDFNNYGLIRSVSDHLAIVFDV